MLRNNSLPLLFKNNNNLDMPGKKLPLLPAAQREELFAGGINGFRVSYLFDSGERAERHYNAQLLAQALYHVGATLINNGEAYRSGRGASSKDSAMLERQDVRSFLMQEYEQLPAYTAWNGGHSASNPLHAVYVMKVALDHLSPAKIYALYKELKQQSESMTMTFVPMTLPNGSQFLNDHATYQVLGGYIVRHLTEKFSFIPPSEQQKLIKARDDKGLGFDFFILGSSPSQKECDTLNHLLGKKVSLDFQEGKVITMGAEPALEDTWRCSIL